MSILTFSKHCCQSIPVSPYASEDTRPYQSMCLLQSAKLQHRTPTPKARANQTILFPRLVRAEPLTASTHVLSAKSRIPTPNSNVPKLVQVTSSQPFTYHPHRRRPHPPSQATHKSASKRTSASIAQQAPSPPPATAPFHARYKSQAQHTASPSKPHTHQ